MISKDVRRLWLKTSQWGVEIVSQNKEMNFPTGLLGSGANGKKKVKGRVLAAHDWWSPPCLLPLVTFRHWFCTRIEACSSPHLSSVRIVCTKVLAKHCLSEMKQKGRANMKYRVVCWKHTVCLSKIVSACACRGQKGEKGGKDPGDKIFYETLKRAIKEKSLHGYGATLSQKFSNFIALKSLKKSGGGLDLSRADPLRRIQNRARCAPVLKNGLPKRTKKAGSDQISSHLLRYEAWIWWSTTFLHDRRDRSRASRKKKLSDCLCQRVRADAVVLARLSFSEASLASAANENAETTWRLSLFVWRGGMGAWTPFGDCARQVNALSRRSPLCRNDQSLREVEQTRHTEVETNYDSDKQTWRSSLAIDERHWWDLGLNSMWWLRKSAHCRCFPLRRRNDQSSREVG